MRCSCQQPAGTLASGQLLCSHVNTTRHDVAEHVLPTIAPHCSSEKPPWKVCAAPNMSAQPSSSPALICVRVVVAEGLQGITCHLVILVGHLLVGSSGAQLLHIVPPATRQQQEPRSDYNVHAGVRHSTIFPAMHAREYSSAQLAPEGCSGAVKRCPADPGCRVQRCHSLQHGSTTPADCNTSLGLAATHATCTVSTPTPPLSKEVCVTYTCPRWLRPDTTHAVAPNTSTIPNQPVLGCTCTEPNCKHPNQHETAHDTTDAGGAYVVYSRSGAVRCITTLAGVLCLLDRLSHLQCVYKNQV